MEREKREWYRTESSRSEAGACLNPCYSPPNVPGLGGVNHQGTRRTQRGGNPKMGLGLACQTQQPETPLDCILTMTEVLKFYSLCNTSSGQHYSLGPSSTPVIIQHQSFTPPSHHSNPIPNNKPIPLMLSSGTLASGALLSLTFPGQIAPWPALCSLTCPLLTAACWAEQLKMIAVRNFSSSCGVRSRHGKPGYGREGRGCGGDWIPRGSSGLGLSAGGE